MAPRMVIVSIASERTRARIRLRCRPSGEISSLRGVFEVVGQIQDVQTIAVGRGIRGLHGIGRKELKIKRLLASR